MTLPPSPEEEIHYEESVASSDEEDLNRMTDEVASSYEEDPDRMTDEVASSDEEDLNRMTDEVRLEEKENHQYDSDVGPFHKMYDKPEINVEVPPSYICTLKAKPVSNEKKNEELLNMPENIKKKSECLGTRDRSEMFKIEGDFNIDEEFNVMVKFGGDESNQYLDFFAVVKYDKAWLEIPAEQKNDQVIFKTKKMEYFFIICSPKTSTMQLNSESDKIYKHEFDPKIMVEFQKGSVDNTTPISITVLPVIRKQLAKLKNDFENPIIEDMSPMLIVSQPGKTDFNKPVRCTLPCKPLASSENRMIIMVRLDRDDQAVISEVETNENDNGTHSCEVKSINIFSIVQTKQPVRDNNSSMNALRDELLYVVGEAKRCILLTYMNKPKRLIRTEIIEIEAKEKVKETMLTNGFRRLDEGSKVVTLRKGQRIRAELRGRIQRQPARKYFGLFVVFQPYLDKKYMEFRFKINNQMGAALHGEIRYCSDNFDKRVLHTLHFDPSGLFADKGISNPNPFPLYRPRYDYRNRIRPNQAVDIGGRGNQLTPRTQTMVGATRNPVTTPRH